MKQYLYVVNPDRTTAYFMTITTHRTEHYKQSTCFLKSNKKTKCPFINNVNVFHVWCVENHCPVHQLRPILFLKLSTKHNESGLFNKNKGFSDKPLSQFRNVSSITEGNFNFYLLISTKLVFLTEEIF